MFTRKESLPDPVRSDAITCYHCGDPCRDDKVIAFEKYFCCEGCKLVYEILSENNLCTYYQLNEAPGKRERENGREGNFAYLGDENIVKSLLTFSDGTTASVTLHVPQAHCSSCIWLLEHLHKLNGAIRKSTVNFLRREVSVVFAEKETSLREIVELLDRLGYTPAIHFNETETPRKPVVSREIYYKLGVAFFCFGNIMLLSFPEYFGLDSLTDFHFRNLFGYLNILLSLPVLLYADTGFFKSAYLGLKQGRLNMDFPISLGIAAMYGRSLYEILSGSGSGYMDTFSALIFFMLVGRLFQDKTYARLAFDRDYKSYFPIAVNVIRNQKELPVRISELKKGDTIVVRNGEIVPADCILLKGNANMDYSFVTGESNPVHKNAGERIYAGGKQIGSSVELTVLNSVSQSRLTRLWDEGNYKTRDPQLVSALVDRVSMVFTISIVLISFASAAWYLFHDEMPKSLNAFTAILIITCPCALALSYPFTLGNSMRILGKNGFFLRNNRVIEKLAGVTDIVFDKTGTLTENGEASITYSGTSFTNHHKTALASLLNQSSHPLSRSLKKYFSGNTCLSVEHFEEIPGSGIRGTIHDEEYQAGSYQFIYGIPEHQESGESGAAVYWSLNRVPMGRFLLSNVYRQGVNRLVNELESGYELHLVSGDNDSERKAFSEFNGLKNNLHFKKSPVGKLKYIDKLHDKGKKVLMVGDGLNDAGALLESDCGIAVSDNLNNFSPACDGILDATTLERLPVFMRFSGNTMRVLYFSYAISLLYNLIGIGYAIQGNLSPVIAAVIMPMSTVTIILIATAGSNIAARLSGLKANRQSLELSKYHVDKNHPYV